MTTNLRSTFFAISAIATLASPLSALAAPNDFVASYPQTQGQSANPAQDYIDGLSGKPFTATKREARGPALRFEGGATYIESFSNRSQHRDTDAGRSAEIADGLTRPSTLIR